MEALAVTNSYTVPELHTERLYSTVAIDSVLSNPSSFSSSAMDISFAVNSSSSTGAVSPSTSTQCSLAFRANASVAVTYVSHSSGILSGQSSEPASKRWCQQFA